MSDLISRRAAIDAARSHYDEYHTGDDSIEELLENLPSAQPAPQWIPCSERLPEEDMDVLVWVYGAFDIARVDRDCDTREWRWSFEEFNLYGDEMEQVVAWMPMPEPYEGGEDE